MINVLTISQDPVHAHIVYLLGLHKLFKWVLNMLIGKVKELEVSI